MMDYGLQETFIMNQQCHLNVLMLWFDNGQDDIIILLEKMKYQLNEKKTHLLQELEEKH